MGVPIDVWRARIGLFGGGTKLSLGGSFGTEDVITRLFITNLQMLMAAAAVISSLLLISGIESNPGPFPCKRCSMVPETVASNVKHQRFHATNKNFMYYCPTETCNFSSKSYGTLNYHVSQYHSATRHQDPAATCSLVCPHIIDGENCVFSTTSLWELVQHLCSHLDAGVSIMCPVEGCTFSNQFTMKKPFRVHLSQYHPNWRAEGCPKQRFQSRFLNEEASGEEVFVPMEVCEEVTPELPTFDDTANCDLLNDELIYDNIAKFYLNLYGENVLPYETIQEISEDITFISEVVNARVQYVLATELKNLGLPADQIRSLCHKVMLADPLYVTHHKHIPGPNLSSDYFRKKYFSQNFDYIAPEEINLNENDETSNQKAQYVKIESTLNKLLKDPSIQKQIDTSFSRHQMDNNIVSDYTDGSQFISEDHPPKEIQIFVYQDSLNAVMNPLGSAKNKFKTLAMYFTIGNLQPHLRSKIITKHLVMLVRESVFKAVGSEKCFAKPIKELKKLETEGIFYKGEILKVVVEFVLGDSLGQHVIGGFIESFSAKFFCRFCDVTKASFKANPHLTNDQRTISDYNKCVMKAKLLGINHCKGVKTDSVLNCLKYVHATSHLAPCLAHDLFEGVVSWDMSSIIANLVYKKKYFTHDFLNRRLKQFTCLAGDAPNKPACVPKKGDKLGGHAVQNWTLLRIFPFIIGDKIQDHEDPSWILYLKLKELCEYLTAPSFKKTDVPFIKDVLLPAYFEQRALVLSQTENPLRPKHHFMAHYPELMLRYGPLLHLWTLAYEQKHKFFKHVMRLSRNYINPEFTCAVRHQLNFCHLTMSHLFPEGCSEVNTKVLSASLFKDDLAGYITNLNLQGPWQSSEAVCCNGLDFEIGNLLLLSSEGRCIRSGIIKVIASSADSLYFILEVFDADINNEEGIYTLPSDSNGDLLWISVADLKFPVHHPVYEYRGKRCYSLKHKLL